MADDKQDDKEKREQFKKGLQEACDQACFNKPDAIRVFFCNNKDIPKEFRGNGDRTYGFLYATTILRTLGTDKGMDILLKTRTCSDQEMEAAYLVVAGVALDFDNRDAAWTLVKRELAWECKVMGKLIARAMRLDSDPDQHHALAALANECKWCAREVCGVKEDNE